MKTPIILTLVFFVILVFVGYRFVFNTKATIAKYVSLSKMKKDSFVYRQTTSDWNVVLMRVCGVLLMIMAIFSSILVIYYHVLKK